MGQNETAAHNDRAVSLVCKICISSRELDAILLNSKQRKIAKRKHDVNEKNSFDVRSAFF